MKTFLNNKILLSVIVLIGLYFIVGWLHQKYFYMKFKNEGFAAIILFNNSHSDTALYIQRVSPGDLNVDLSERNITIQDTECTFFERFPDLPTDDKIKIMVGSLHKNKSYKWNYGAKQELAIIEYDKDGKFTKYQRWVNGSGKIGINPPDLSKTIFE